MDLLLLIQFPTEETFLMPFPGFLPTLLRVGNWETEETLASQIPIPRLPGHVIAHHRIMGGLIVGVIYD